MKICVFVTTHRSSAWTHKTQIQAMYLPLPPPIAKDVSNLMRLLLRLAGGGGIFIGATFIQHNG